MRWEDAEKIYSIMGEYYNAKWMLSLCSDAAKPKFEETITRIRNQIKCFEMTTEELEELKRQIKESEERTSSLNKKLDEALRSENYTGRFFKFRDGYIKVGEKTNYMFLDGYRVDRAVLGGRQLVLETDSFMSQAEFYMLDEITAEEMNRVLDEYTDSFKRRTPHDIDF